MGLSSAALKAIRRYWLERFTLEEIRELAVIELARYSGECGQTMGTGEDSRVTDCQLDRTKSLVSCHPAVTLRALDFTRRRHLCFPFLVGRKAPLAIDPGSL